MGIGKVAPELDFMLVSAIPAVELGRSYWGEYSILHWFKSCIAHPMQISISKTSPTQNLPKT